MGSGEYFTRAAAAAALVDPPLTLDIVPSWHKTAEFAPILANRTRAVLAGLDPTARERTAVFFTAHSLPQRVVTEGDPYPEQVAESGADIAALLDLDADPSVQWSTAWQSAGRTADPWIGPDLLLEMDRVAAEGTTAVVVCAVGFVSDHLEVLYDLDIEAQDRADALGIAFARTTSLNDDPAFLAMLAGVVRTAAGSPIRRP
jgi:ferrochelatase